MELDPISYHSEWVKDFNERLKTMELLGENRGKSVFHRLWQQFFWIWQQKHKQQDKNQQVQLLQITQFLHSKRNKQQNGNAVYKIWENTCKLCILKRVNTYDR